MWLQSIFVSICPKVFISSLSQVMLQILRQIIFTARMTSLPHGLQVLLLISHTQLQMLKMAVIFSKLITQALLFSKMVMLSLQKKAVCW